MKRLYKIEYESYSMFGEDTEGTVIKVSVISNTMERALKKFRETLPKNLHYTITYIKQSPYGIVL